MLQERVRVLHPEDFAGCDARLEAALARLSHLLHLKASRPAPARELVHRVELAYDALEPSVFVGRRAASPFAALDLDVVADGRERLRQMRQQLRDEPWLRLGLSLRHSCGEEFEHVPGGV
eukprot:7387227-Prymnesium_polylepis.1